MSEERLGLARVQARFDRRSALAGLEPADFAVRAGRQPKCGFVHEADAAFDPVDGVVRPFVEDLCRRARLGWRRRPRRSPLGVLSGLYRCCGARDGTVLACAGTETPEELAAWVVGESVKAQVKLPPAEAAAAWPGWEPLG